MCQDVIILVSVQVTFLCQSQVVSLLDNILSKKVDFIIRHKNLSQMPLAESTVVSQEIRSPRMKIRKRRFSAVCKITCNFLNCLSFFLLIRFTIFLIYNLSFSLSIDLELQALLVVLYTNLMVPCPDSHLWYRQVQSSHEVQFSPPSSC